MKTIFLKDWRENFKIALLGLIILGVILLQTWQNSVSSLHTLLETGYGMVSNLQPLLSQPLQMETAFFCAIFGAGLGWFQTRNEGHRDLWAYLVHRPVTRTDIFRGKALAGLSLYTFGAGLPLGLLVAFAIMPGHVAAPFTWSMVLPLAGIFVSGIAFYFAGLLAGWRNARWFGSRTFGLLPAILTSAVAFQLMQAWALFFVDTLVIPVLALAAWGACQGGGDYRTQPAASRLALSIVLAAGCCGVLILAASLVFDVLLSSVLPRSNTGYGYTGKSYTVTSDGKICVVTSRGGYETDYTDLAGHPLLNPQTGKKLKRNEFNLRRAIGAVIGSRFSPQAGRIEENLFHLYNISDKTLWYLFQGKLVGFDGRSKQCVGTLELHGPDGQQGTAPLLPRATDYFNNQYYSSSDSPVTMLASAKSVYVVDFSERTAHAVFSLTNDDEIGGCVEFNYAYGINHRQAMITTRQCVSLLDEDGRAVFTLPYQPGYAQYPTVGLDIISPGKSNTNAYALEFYPNYVTNQACGWTLPDKYLWLSKTNLLVSQTLDLPVIHEADKIYWTDRLLNVFAPAISQVDYGKHIFRHWNRWTSLSWAVGLLCALFAWPVMQRYHFTTAERIGWGLVIGLLGIAGLLTLWCTQDWPARVPCPACQKRRTVDRAICEHCDAPFPPPEQNGTEIFAPLVKV